MKKVCTYKETHIRKINGIECLFTTQVRTWKDVQNGTSYGTLLAKAKGTSPIRR